MVITTCTSISSSTGIGSGCAINIAYNTQLPLCTKSGQRACRHPDELCVADANFDFSLQESSSSNVKRLNN